jgi:hypothetical protein
MLEMNHTARDEPHCHHVVITSTSHTTDPVWQVVSKPVLPAVAEEWREATRGAFELLYGTHDACDVQLAEAESALDDVQKAFGGRNLRKLGRGPRRGPNLLTTPGRGSLNRMVLP